MSGGVIQGLVSLSAHQIFNEKTLKLINTEQREHQWSEIKKQRGRKGDLTVVLKGTAIMQKCFLPDVKHECHSVLQCGWHSLHDMLSPITRQEDITSKK